LICAEVKRSFHYFDTRCKEVFSLQCSAAESFSEGLAVVLAQKKMGFIDKTGTIARPFREGLAVVAVSFEDKPGRPLLYGFINQKGEQVVPPRYTIASAFSEGLASVGQGTQDFCYINPHAEEVLGPFRCEGAGPFQEGLARIQKGEAFGYIDKRGQWVWKLDTEGH
jgi:hypothetical protein